MGKDIKEKLKNRYENNLEKGFSREEALSRAIEEERKNHDKSDFERTVVEFLKERFPEYLGEEDSFQALIDSIYLESELLLSKVRAFLSSK
ncbi:hypothetical protein [Desulfurobacterium sp.]